ncbi:uncharacterized protein J3D65DRAFT_629765 [Phyllosticta citribraziliensis]|uniref:Uncharacterized protein n=1 Tax=Phyllosticta citribraziliensis TaxID=989973 RepID=A0ABR1LIH7_9PEZI
MKAESCLVVSAIAVVAVAQSSGSMCGITGHRLALVDNRLFFASGNYTFADDKSWHNTSYMYWLDLESDFSVDGMLGTDILSQSDLPSEDLSSGEREVSGGASGAFFYDHTNLYAYGGFVGVSVNGINESLWSYNTTSGNWSLAPIDSGSIVFGDSTEGIYASDQATGRSWMTGGWKIDFEGANNGMIAFETDNSDNLTLAFNNDVGLPTLKGVMVYTRKGEQGTLISFGGDDTTDSQTYNGETIWNERNMADIFIFDIASSTWYNITATGDIPDPRIEFCAGLSAAPDDSSFQISIHGGWSQERTIALNDVYVLTVPGFQWIKINSTGDPDTADNKYAGRHRHKCEVWDQRQLLVVGGEVYANGSTLNNNCNATAHPPIKVLDTTSFVWRTEFRTNQTYEVPEVVYSVIGGNSSGGANVTAPQGGWNSTRLENIFNQTVARDTYVPPSGSSTNSPTATSSSLPGSGSSSHAGAIAGGVLGGLAGVALILVGILFWLKKLKKSKESSETKEASVAPTENEMSPDSALGELDGYFRAEAPADNDRQELSNDGLLVEKPAGPTDTVHEMPEKPTRRSVHEMA